MRLCVIAGLILAVACSDQAPAPSVAGSWSGTTSGGATFALTLAQDGTTVSGTGQANGPGGALALDVTGTFVPPDVSLTLSSQGYAPVNFSGEYDGSMMTGALNGSGYNNTMFTFRRK